MDPLTPAAARERLRALAHQSFGFYPTPLEALPRLRAALGARAPRLLIKRDDYTGFALGGNKVRKLEYELAPERVRDVDVLITAGGFGSNHARVTAAAAARLGLRCILVLNGTPPDPPRGNALLQRLFGAEIIPVAAREERAPRMQQIAAELAAQGQRALVVPLGASTPQGALGYAVAALELAAQLKIIPRGSDPIWLVVSASSAGTLAGLLLGLALAERADVRTIGVSPDDPAAGIRDTARRTAQDAADLLGYSLKLDPETPIVTSDYVGGGYGVPTDASTEALRQFARTEGVVLDPVYTAKAAACLIDWVQSARFAADDTVVFWHTGGHPALFA
ncbi:MAG TPA: pyridoxal-phosphate dependent enzyme [Longimicrobiales bacterium]|nr:pyridoxal-phosphate dependent enzyme [Longimicrobiales bacterium]